MRKKIVKKPVKKIVKKSVQHSVTPVAPPKQIPYRTPSEKYGDGLKMLKSKHDEGLRSTLQNASDSMLILGYHLPEHQAAIHNIYIHMVDLYEKIS